MVEILSQAAKCCDHTSLADENVTSSLATAIAAAITAAITAANAAAIAAATTPRQLFSGTERKAKNIPQYQQQPCSRRLTANVTLLFNHVCKILF